MGHPPTFIHPNALVESTSIGAGTRIWAFAHVLADATIGSNCNIGDHVFVESGAVIGNNVTVKNNVLIWDGVSIDDDAFIGPNVVFTNDMFPRSPRMPEVIERYANRESWLSPTFVERGCSIGANVTILPGVRLGQYSMIGAGSTVTRDVEPFSLVVGSPAKFVGRVCRCGSRIESNAATHCKSCEQNESSENGSTAKGPLPKAKPTTD